MARVKGFRGAWIREKEREAACLVALKKKRNALANWKEKKSPNASPGAC